MPVLDSQALIDNRVDAIRLFHQQTGATRAELDVSGGVDSATLLALLGRALGPDNITAVYSGINSSDESRQRAQEVSESTGVRLIQVDLTQVYESLIRTMRDAFPDAGYDIGQIDERITRAPMVLGSIRSTLRAPVGRGFNRMTGGGIRHGTGNECEDRWLRFFQKGGDGEVDTNPIAMLAKGEVFQLAHALGVPPSIIEALPTPDLWGTGDDHNDEDELMAWTGVPFTYSRVDAVSGQYTRVGTIERISRFVDTLEAQDQTIFDDAMTEDVLSSIIHNAAKATEFSGIEAQQVGQLIRGAKRVERLTRHKMNPNCPALGDRTTLVKSRILTNSIVF